MIIELDLGYTLEIYEKGNYGTVKQKYFVDMIDLVTFTNRNARNYSTDYIINVTDKTDNISLYKGCIHAFNIKINKILVFVLSSVL